VISSSGASSADERCCWRMKINTDGKHVKTVKSLRLVVAALCGLYTALNPTFAQTWTQQTNAPSGTWVSSSADGTKLVALTSSGIATSTNSGVTWTIATGIPQNMWRAVASSADGTRLVAISYPASIYANYISTNSGVTWNALTNALDAGSGWWAIAGSADGTKLVAATEQHGLIVTSTNSGATWMSNNVPPSGQWVAVASSADGSRLVAMQMGGAVYTSTNSGTTWTQPSAPNASWTSVASSADGTKLVAVAGSSSIYTSTNSGANWRMNNAPSQSYTSVASSADGNKLVAAAKWAGLIYTSTDAGANWTSNNVPPGQTWNSVASSADGNKLVTIGTMVCTRQSTPVPLLNLTPSAGELALAWIVPSMEFVLQQNSDLSTTHWVTLTDPPVLNFTNLQNQVMLLRSNSQNYYRLLCP